MRQNVVTVARYFHYHFNTFFQVFPKSIAHSIDDLVDCAIGIKQLDLHSHFHTILWMKNTPKLNVDIEEVVCSFIDQYVKCGIPDDEELHM